MGKITDRMKECLISIHGELPKSLEYEAKICMVNTFLGEAFNGTFVKEYGSRKEALDFALHLSNFYDIPYTENKEKRYFHFNSFFKDSVYDGISCKLEY